MADRHGPCCRTRDILGVVTRSSRPSAAEALRIGGFALLVISLLLSGCKNCSPTAPAIFKLSGRLLLHGTLRDTTGTPTGARIVDNADSVRVYLLRAGSVVDSTRTVGGAYTFTGLPNGTYRALARLLPGIADTTTAATISNGDLAMPERLDLQPAGTLTASPNPFAGSVRINFSISSSGVVHVRVVSVAGSPIKLLTDSTLVVGQYSFDWDGTDDVGLPVAAGAYWGLFTQGSDNRAELVFRVP